MATSYDRNVVFHAGYSAQTGNPQINTKCGIALSLLLCTQGELKK